MFELEIINLIIEVGGLFGLFVFSIVSASLIPFGLPEAAVFAFWFLDFNPWSVIMIAAVGTTLGAIINYYIGFVGNVYLLNKFIKPAKVAKAESRFKKYGPIILIFSWIPFIGDPLTAVAGLLKYPIKYFLVFVSIGKAFRFIVLYWIFIRL